MKRIINCETGEIVERDLNDQEIAQQEIDEIKFNEFIAKQNEKIAARESASEKLAALGLTSDEVAALIP